MRAMHSSVRPDGTYSMAATAPATSVDFFDALRQREAQAAGFGARHLAVVPDRNSMLYWLAEAAKEARTAISRKQVHVAASADTDQSTVARFEKRIAWPRDPDRIVKAYADDLDFDSLDLWEQAVRMWREDRESQAEMTATVQALEASDAPAEKRRRKS